MRVLPLLVPALLCGAENLDALKPVPKMDALLAGTPSTRPPEPVVSRNATVITIRNDVCCRCHRRNGEHTKECDRALDARDNATTTDHGVQRSEPASRERTTR